MRKKDKKEQLDEEFEEYEEEIEDLETNAAELEAQLAEQTELAKAYLAQLQRVQADFENYQKRIEIEKSQIADIACGELMSGLLETLDNFDRAMESLDNIPEEDAQGMKMVHRALMEYLQKMGLEKINATGSQFNPHMHEAVMQQESDEEDGTVLEEFQNGYSLKGRVIRPSKVKVARGMQEEAASGTDPGDSGSVGDTGDDAAAENDDDNDDDNASNDTVAGDDSGEYKNTGKEKKENTK